MKLCKLILNSKNLNIASFYHSRIKMHSKFESLKQKDDDDQNRPRKKFKKTTYLSSYRFWIALFFLLVASYYLFSSYVAFNLQKDLLLKNDYWDVLSKREKDNCLSNTAFEQKTLITFKELIDYFNKKRDFNYFMCFSSLYYSIKIANYEVFSDIVDQNSFSYKNSRNFVRNQQKCVHQEFCSIYQKSTIKTRLQLCYLKTFLKEKSLCDVVKKFESLFKRTVACEFNFLTGESVVKVNQEVELIFYEYDIGLDPLRFLAGSFYSKQDQTDIQVELFQENAKLNQGWLGKICMNQFFNLPRHFFYSKFYTSKVKSNFLNYLGAPIRLPSDIINYFMIFYSSIWYI